MIGIKPNTGTIFVGLALKGGIDAVMAIENKLPYVIRMPCGEKWLIQTIADIPEKDLPCSCGNKNHWLIKYFT